MKHAKTLLIKQIKTLQAKLEDMKTNPSDPELSADIRFYEDGLAELEKQIKECQSELKFIKRSVKPIHRFYM